MTDARVECVPACLNGIDAKSDVIRFGGIRTKDLQVGVARSRDVRGLPRRRPFASMRNTSFINLRRIEPINGARIVAQLSHQMEIGRKMRASSPPSATLPWAAVPANAGDLDRALIDVHVIDLIRFGG